jgi:hypothetical protein
MTAFHPNINGIVNEEMLEQPTTNPMTVLSDEKKMYLPNGSKRLSKGAGLIPCSVTHYRSPSR